MKGRIEDAGSRAPMQLEIEGSRLQMEDAGSRILLQMEDVDAG